MHINKINCNKYNLKVRNAVSGNSKEWGEKTQKEIEDRTKTVDKI